MLRLGILPGTFNPPTVAHLALARAALRHVDRVLFVLPRVLPHKRFEDATFEQRLEMLRAATESEPRFGIRTSAGGLFIEIAREIREGRGGEERGGEERGAKSEERGAKSEERGARGEERLFFLCGRDAAERIVNWDYGSPGAFARMLEEFDLLVASREGEYSPPEALREHIHALRMPNYDACSATEVRRRIAAGEPWEHLVPREVAPMAQAVYGSSK